MDFVKLSNLVGDTFTVTGVKGFTWKKWDDSEKKMLTSDLYQEGFRKLYQVETDKGQLDLGSGQIGQLLEGVFYNGVADVNGKTFSVKSNGKTGMDIRYYLNPVRNEAAEAKLKAKTPEEEALDEEVANLPF